MTVLDCKNSVAAKKGGGNVTWGLFQARRFIQCGAGAQKSSVPLPTFWSKQQEYHIPLLNFSVCLTFNCVLWTGINIQCIQCSKQLPNITWELAPPAEPSSSPGIEMFSKSTVRRSPSKSQFPHHLVHEFFLCSS